MVIRQQIELDSAPDRCIPRTDNFRIRPDEKKKIRDLRHPARRDFFPCFPCFPWFKFFSTLGLRAKPAPASRGLLLTPFLRLRILWLLILRLRILRVTTLSWLSRKSARAASSNDQHIPRCDGRFFFSFVLGQTPEPLVFLFVHLASDQLEGAPQRPV